MKKKPSTKSARKKAVNASAPGSICVVSFENRTPSGWNATIIQIKAEFTNSDKSTETVGPKSVRIPVGGSEPLMSTDAKKCVVSVFVWITVTDGKDTKTLTRRFNTGPNQCQIYIPAILEQQRTIARKGPAVALSSGPLLEIVSDR